MACIVVFCTTYALILPAITMDQEWYCGFQAHVHTEECWTETTLVEFSCQPVEGAIHSCQEACPWPQNPAHSHDQMCYMELGHAHSDRCYDSAGTLACGIEEKELRLELFCTKVERQPHSHGPECVSETGETVCLLPELTEHIHDENCRTVTVVREMVCRIPEHEHTDLCRPDPNFDVEEAADWEATLGHLTLTDRWNENMEALAKSQIGYRESLRNYDVDADGNRKAYTRYGQWYGVPYGAWDAMFVIFCLHYSGVPQESIPWIADSGRWLEQLRSRGLLVSGENAIPQKGDLLFYENENGQTRAAIVTGTSGSENTLSHLQAVAGDVEGAVAQIHLEAHRILGFCNPESTRKAPEPATVTQWAETENYTVTVSYPETLVLPEGAQLRVTEYPRDSETYLRRCREAGYELEWLLNIGFFLGEEELELEGPFQVSVTNKNGQALDHQVTHFADSGMEQLDGSSDADGSVAFSSDGFSDFGGVTRAASGATVTLELYSHNEWCPITFPTGNHYNTTVGTTVTLTIRGTGARYAAPNLTITGGEVVSQSYSCGTAGCNHQSWCSVNPTHTITIRVTGTGMHVRGFIGGDSSWENSSVSLTSGGGSQPTDPTEPPTQPTEPGPAPDPTYPYYPHAVHTGDVSISRLRFYNLAEDGDNGVSPLLGCVFEITGPNGYSLTITSDDSVEVILPSDIPDGTYTITEVSVPDGYLRDTEYSRTFAIKNGALTSTDNIGTFINHDLGQLESHKSAEVEDYNNRIYRILLAAESHMRLYEMGPVDVLFVVDQSNSMLFPASLEPIGKSVQLRLDGNGNVDRMNQLGLDKNQMYYLISDPQGTSTVWCIWFDGHSWMYQDASYYAKAKHGNVPGYQAPNGEIAIFPQNRSYTDQANAEGEKERSNGGGLGFHLSGSGLGKDIDKYYADVQTYQLYTSPTEYNRLHYLEEALANMIYELADANDKNRVTLTRFTKEVKASDDIGPLELTPDNAEILVNAVRSINTDGGTRQDLALAYVYNNHLNNASQGYTGGQDYTYTILITDGAPVLSSGSSIDNLGSANDAPSTTANSVYAQIKGYAALVRSKSSLMTIGLGLDNVEAGRQVLQEIATNQNFYCAMEDASMLVHNLQQLLFESFKPKEAIDITASVTDEISDSFYPIAWVPQGTASGRQLLLTGGGKDWVLPEAGDWLTLEGGLTTPDASDAAGQLQRREDGTFFIEWKNMVISDPNWHYDNDRIAWVTQGTGASTGRTVVASYGGKDWIELREGDWINRQGGYYAGTPFYTDQRNYGQIRKSGEDYYVSWGSGANGDSRERFVSEYGWRGTFYVKAKEDFIGGNAIETNKNAWVSTQNTSKSFPDPTVNVRLLDLNEFSGEVTVFLGDTVNEEGHSPLDSVQEFYEKIRFEKLISDGGDVLNRVTAESAEGLEAAVFYLEYALGRDLTVDEWNSLITGGTLTVPHVYDYPSSGGDVGYFTITLDKSGIDGALPSWKEHRAEADCQSMGTPATEDCLEPAEIYRLDITYTAYRLGENGRPEANAHNGENGPGTEVGTGSTPETGAGTLESHNIHEVHVISGAIEIHKVFEEGYSHTEDQVFTFVLHRLEDGEDTSKDLVKTVTIPAGQSQGSASVIFSHLPRGTYSVTEALNGNFTVKGIRVTSDTNCYSNPGPGKTAMSVTFTLGHDPEEENVIGRAPESAAYTSYINPGYGVYGEAVFTNGEIVYYGEVPVRKIWSNGQENHTDQDAVYVVLLRDGVPVTDDNGNARLLRLDASSGWVGSFQVVLSGPEDRVSNYDYSVREVSGTSDSLRDGWTAALLANNGETVLWYETALEEGRIIGISGDGYQVWYETDENGVLLVRNVRAVELPSTGGPGTQRYTISGLALIALALLYGCSQRRRRERGADS